MYADTWADLEASACPTCPMTVGLTQHRRDPDGGAMPQRAYWTHSPVRLFSVYCQALQSSGAWLKGIVDYIVQF